jgi:hypothetical protein
MGRGNSIEQGSKTIGVGGKRFRDLVAQICHALGQGHRCKFEILCGISTRPPGPRELVQTVLVQVTGDFADDMVVKCFHTSSIHFFYIDDALTFRFLESMTATHIVTTTATDAIPTAGEDVAYAAEAADPSDARDISAREAYDATADCPSSYDDMY